MKKIISIILSLSMLLTVLPSFASQAVASENDYEYFLEARELLVGLGCKDVTDKKDTVITRDAWISLATEFSHYQSISRINLANAGIHSDTNYYFLPENPIKVKDALIMLVKLLGYQPGVEYADSVYINFATKLDLADGINSSMDSDLTYEGAYILLYNYLRANTAEINLTDADVNIRTGDTSILYEKYNIVEVYGQITESPGYSLKDAYGIDFGYVTIGDELCRNPRYNGDEYFGKYVTAYVKDYDSASAEIVAMFADDKTESLTIYSDDCISYDKRILVYADENGKNKSKKISINADVFCNGERFDYKTDFIPETGKITVLDNGIHSDGADIVIIEKTEDIKLTSVLPNSKTVYSSDKKGAALVIDEEVSLTAPDGEVFDFENLTSGDVLTTWFKSDGTIWKAIVNNYSMTEVISEVSQNGVVILGKEYGFSKSRYEQFKDVIKPAVTVNALINIYGEICDMTSAVSVDGLPGVMLAIGNVKKGLSQNLSIKMYNPSDGIVVYPVSENASINGKRFKTIDEMDAQFEKFEGTSNEVQKFIIYKLNEEKTIVTSIDFATEIPMTANGDSKVYLTKAVDNTDTVTGKYRRWSKMFGHDIIVEPSSTTMFRLPKQSETGEINDNPDYFSNTKFSGITSGTTYSECKVRAYTLNPKSKIAQFLTIEYDASDSSSETPKSGTRASMVGSISTKMYNDEPNESVVIYNYNYPTGITVYGKNATYFSDLGIESGDIIHLEYNSTTKVAKAVKLLWKKDAKNLANNTLSYGSEGGITDIRYCKVYKMWEGIADMFFDDEDLSVQNTDNAMVFRTDMFQIFKYNERLKTVETVSADEFVAYDAVGDDLCSRVIVELRYRESVSMFLID
ncbi:MAG: hypothetical protein IJB70_08135 [Clostridia bacterium]|nr:hypothetical protein [Clostridia bacterium]